MKPATSFLPFLGRPRAVLAIVLLVTSLGLLAAPHHDQRPVVVEFLLHDTLQAASTEALATNLKVAEELNPVAVIVNLSSPGGFGENAAAMAELIRQNRTPVVMFAREPGTRVAGEALRLLAAGDVRAMNPAAVLVPLNGGFSRSVGEAERERCRNRLAEELRRELTLRHRDTGAVEELAHGNRVIEADEALQRGVVELVPYNEEALLRSLDGMEIHRANGAEVRLNLKNAHLEEVTLSFRQQLMRALMNPDLAVLLLTLGSLLVYLEINTPGGVFPGAAGTLLVLLSLSAFHRMPLRTDGIFLLVTSLLLLAAEAYFQRGGGLLAACSMIALVIGLKRVVHGPIPEMEVNWSTAVGAGVGFGGLTAGLVLLGMRARRSKMRTGSDAMLGWLAVTQTPLAPEGQVLVRGELWRARLSESNTYLPAGECVKVNRSDGMVLEVTPMPLASK